MIDFEVRDEGSLVMFNACSDAAKDWWREHVQAAPSLGVWKAVEHRYADAILAGIVDEGMTIEGY